MTLNERLEIQVVQVQRNASDSDERSQLGVGAVASARRWSRIPRRA